MDNGDVWSKVGDDNIVVDAGQNVSAPVVGVVPAEITPTTVPGDGGKKRTIFQMLRHRRATGVLPLTSAAFLNGGPGQ